MAARSLHNFCGSEALFSHKNRIKSPLDASHCALKRKDSFQKSRSLFCCVATTDITAEPPEVSLETRKKASEDAAAMKPYTLSEVEAVSPNDFNTAIITDVKDVATGVRVLTLDAEISREFVSLENAYTQPGQKVQIKLPGGQQFTVPACSPVFPAETNRSVLLKVRGDIPAGSTKLAQYGISVRSPLDIQVSEEFAPELFNAEPGTEVEVGPFQSPPDYRPIMFLTRYPTVLIFATGDGIAGARALIEAKDTGSLYLNMRDEVRLYYGASTPDCLAYQDEWSRWESRNVKIRPTVESVMGERWDGHVGSLADLFDEDDLEYDPSTTSAVVFGSKEENKAVLKILNAAEIPEKAIVAVEL